MSSFPTTDLALASDVFPPKIFASAFLFSIMATIRLISEQEQISKGVLSGIVIQPNFEPKTSNMAENIPTPLFQSLDCFTIDEFSRLEFSQRYDLAIVVLENLATDQVNNANASVIMSCRDLFARHCLVFAPCEQNLTAFGFTKFDSQKMTVDDCDYYAWQFNLFDYKHLPDWFNSRFWANPENWNKFRW